MAGIYIHIPFCKQRCTYCDFYTRVAPSKTNDVVNAIVSELDVRTDFLPTIDIDTIYFGGGTPSLLTAEQFALILDKISSVYKVSKTAEITFEANPEDLTAVFFDSISHLPFNRISMGIQTFDDVQLKSINRRHTGDGAVEAFQNARNAGFNNISVDLIYGLPGQSIQNWNTQLLKAISLKPEHISVYGLTYEEGTPLQHFAVKNKITKVNDDSMIEMHLMTFNLLQNAGYNAYEISNYALPGFQSRHNSAYWKAIPYIGLGPSAHSFNGKVRQWNVASIKEYTEKINKNEVFYELETLTDNDRYNEYIMVGLRTSDGIDRDFISNNFNKSQLNYFENILSKYKNNKYLSIENSSIKLTSEGILISNTIIEDFIIV